MSYGILTEENVLSSLKNRATDNIGTFGNKIKAMRFTGEELRRLHLSGMLSAFFDATFKALPSDTVIVTLDGRILRQDVLSPFWQDTYSMMLSSDEWAELAQGDMMPVIKPVFQLSVSLETE